MLDAMTPSIGTWLKETRLRQVDPETGRPWSQARLAEMVTAETGWTLLRENYSRYESGATTPTPETLARFVEFWQAHGEPGPDLTPQPAPLSLEERAVLAAEAQVEATRENTAMLAQLLAQLTGQPLVHPRAQAAVQAQADAEPHASPLPQPGPTGTTGR